MVKHPNLIFIPSSPSPYKILIRLIVCVLVGMIASVSLAMPAFYWIMSLFSNLSFNSFRSRLIIGQVFVSLGGFIFAPLIYWRYATKGKSPFFSNYKNLNIKNFVIVLSLMLVSMVINSWFIKWNADLKLPSWLSSFEAWAKQQEDARQQIIDIITNFNSLGSFLIGIVVIGIIPAFGEEILFRGIIQNIICSIKKNMSFSIVITAFVFSAIHVQFYGFIPRFLLGILFGYIYWYTNNLIYPIFAHFVHNSLVVTMLFLKQKSIVQYDINENEAAPIPLTLLCCFIVVFLIHILKAKKNLLVSNESDHSRI